MSWRSGPSCSKLTTSLVIISLKFQTLISQIRQYFLLKKYEKLIFSTKNITVFATGALSWKGFTVSSSTSPVLQIRTGKRDNLGIISHILL